METIQLSTHCHGLHPAPGLHGEAQTPFSAVVLPEQFHPTELTGVNALGAVVHCAAACVTAIARAAIATSSGMLLAAGVLMDHLLYQSISISTTARADQHLDAWNRGHNASHMQPCLAE